MEPTRMSTPAQLIAALPTMLSYVPDERVVMVLLRDRSIIAAGAFSLDVIDDPDFLYGRMEAAVDSANPTRFLCAVISEDRTLWAEVAHVVQNLAERLGLDVSDYMYAEKIADGEEVYSSLRDEASIISDPALSPLATVAAVEHGQRIGLSRDELAAVYRPDALADVRRAQVEEVEERATAAAARETVQSAIDGRTDEDAMIRAAAALNDLHARDIVLGLAMSSRGVEFAEWLSTVARQVGTVDSYAVASLASYVTGRTVIANILLEQGPEGDETSRLLFLAERVQRAAIAPDEVRKWLSEATREAADRFGVVLPD